ncbi:hypothetical protein IJO12_06280 [bacterium]|nr:hypothetical protein [bacterium]
MSIGISNANNFHQYENREYIKDVAGKILNTNGYNSNLNSIIDKSYTNTDFSNYTNAQLAIIKASTQISLNNPLKETLKYLNTKSKKNNKQPILGELWNILSLSNEDDSDFINQIEIDFTRNNIFTAA